jgi:signal transduction histidine kinase
MKALLFGLFIAIVTLQTEAQIITWDGSVDHLKIGKNIYFLEDKEGVLNINDVSSKAYDNKFTSSKKNILDFGYSESTYWLKFSLHNSTNDSLILEIAHATLPITDLYYRNADGNFNQIKGGYKIPINEKNIIHHFQAFTLPKGKNIFYVRVISNSHPLPIRIWKPKAYSIKAYHQKLGYGFYLGFMIFVIITNIFFFFSLRNRIYLFYALVAFIYTCYASIVMDGFLLYFIPQMDMMFWYLTIPTIGVTVQTAYCLEFLETKKYIPSFHNLLRYIVSYFFIYMIVRPLIPLIPTLGINTAHALLSFFIMGFVGVQVGKKGNKMGYYYASAYGIYFILVVTEAIYIQTGFPGYIFGLSHVAIATIVEAFILSFLLSKKTEWERNASEREKLHAQQELVKAAQENDRIIMEQNTLLEKKVIERTESLNKANNKLEVANATKDKFFSIIAHDLRSPFNAMLGISDILLDEHEEVSESEKQEYLDMLHTGLNNTHNLLDNLLLWASTQRDSIGFKPEKINLNQVTNETIRHLKQQSEAKRILLKNNIQSNSYAVADRNMILTILRNLITNAIKFTPKGGEVNICADSISNDGNQNNTIVSVLDSGIGISLQQQSELFKLTSNLSTLGTENESGTGLGLIICKELVEKNKGKIWVDSELGKGATFCFTIPSATN